MKKITLILAAVALVFGLSRCTSSPKEAILAEVNEFFAQAESKIAAIDNAADLMEFVKNFATEKENFGQMLDEKYKADENGLYKGMNAEGMETLMNAINERASSYNAVEYAKCGEIMTPYIDRVEAAVSNLQNMFDNGEEVSDEAIDEYINAAEELETYSDIVPEEIAERYYKADDTIVKLFGLEEE